MIPRVQIPRSQFDRNHQYKSTMNSGYLIPFYVDEALPGDTFTLDASVFTRLTTPIVPIMDNLYYEIFYFAVPVRLIWEHWQEFNGEVIDPNDPEAQTDYLIPQIQSGDSGFALGSISDYFGLPINIPNLSVSALWHRAYNLIYNEWFRDENLCSPVPVNRGDGPDSLEDYTLLKRGKRHDYFTSCLPWPQKGDPVGISLGGQAQVYGVADTGLGMVGYSFSGDNPNLNQLIGNHLTSSGSYSNTAYRDFLISTDNSTGVPNVDSYLNVASKESGKPSNLYADLTDISAITVNTLRQAFQLQRLLEKDARGGTRYTEILRSQFGVISPDARLQRPEYLGGDRGRIHFNSVAQTSSTDQESPQGNLSAFALGSSSSRGFSKSFVEHNVIIGLINFYCDLTYQDGINRMFSRKTRYDYYWPSLAYLGEQAVLNKEIFAQGNADDEKVFGYQERWAEYRYKPSQITGLFRSSAPESLDIWHLAQDFSSLPVLNADFIEENPPIKRILAVQNQPEFLVDIDIRLKCVRPMPVYSVPGLIDHF